jgi:hypothetical protein
LDHDYLASFKLLELMLLRGGLGGNHLKAGGYEHAPRFVVRTRRCCGGAPGHQRQQRCGTDHYEEDSFHLVPFFPRHIGSAITGLKEAKNRGEEFSG